MDPAKVNYHFEVCQIKQTTNQRVKSDDGNILTPPEYIKKGKKIKQTTVKIDHRMGGGEGDMPAFSEERKHESEIDRPVPH